MENKKGSHVGMILSFALFITFVVFIYTIVNPTINTSESKKTLLNEIGLRLIDNMSSDFTTFSVNIDQNPSTACVILEGVIYYAEISPSTLIYDESHNAQEVYYNPATDFNNLRIVRTSSSDSFLKIYSSPEFDKVPEDSTTSCSTVSFESGYSIGSWTSGQYIFEKNLVDLVDYYNRYYDTLKSELKISPGNEFGFEFTLTNGTKLTAVSDLPTQNIYAEDIPIQYIDDDANIQSGFINVKVW